MTQVVERSVEAIHLADFYYASIEDLNLHLSLTEVFVWESVEQQPPEIALGHEMNTSEYLGVFKDWHFHNLHSLPNHDNAMIFSGLNYTLFSDNWVPLEEGGNRTVGRGYTQHVCNSIYSSKLLKSHYIHPRPENGCPLQNCSENTFPNVEFSVIKNGHNKFKRSKNTKSPFFQQLKMISQFGKT